MIMITFRYECGQSGSDRVVEIETFISRSKDIYSPVQSVSVYGQHVSFAGGGVVWSRLSEAGGGKHPQLWPCGQ